MTASFSPQNAMPVRPTTVGEAGHLAAHQAMHDVVSELRAYAQTDAVPASMLLYAARRPEDMAVGTITYSNTAPVSHNVKWPDGAAGVYTGVASTAAPGSVDSYKITYVPTSGATTKTYTQAAVTRDSTTGQITNRPDITVA